MHPYQTQALATLKIRDWHQQAEQARRAKHARRIRRARRAAEPAGHVLAHRGAAVSQPETAPEREPAGTRAA